jgi:hypothetical protein
VRSESAAAGSLANNAPITDCLAQAQPTRNPSTTLSSMVSRLATALATAAKNRRASRPRAACTSSSRLSKRR